MWQEIDREILLELRRLLHLAEASQTSPAAPAPSLSAAASAPAPVAAAEWRNDINYDSLIHNPAVRNLLAKQKPPAYRMTGEEFVEGLGSLLPVKVPLTPLMNFSKDLGGRLGIHTGKSRAEQYARQATDGCVLICEIPSDVSASPPRSCSPSTGSLPP
jgi:hypothetical protein